MKRQMIDDTVKNDRVIYRRENVQKQKKARKTRKK